jgi:hypothetical protein
MSRICTVAFALGLAIALPAFAVDAPKDPIVLKSAKQGDVTFKHQTHAKVECKVCHAGDPGKNPVLEAGGPAAMKAAHAVCQDCHKKQENKALAKCDNCHHKAK